jgi:hypothetical protein
VYGRERGDGTWSRLTGTVITKIRYWGSSNSITFIASFVKIRQMVQKLKWGTYRKHGDLISLLSIHKKGK